ncbi:MULTISPECIES: hypothetical protein [Bradyrhizobium]|uniref:hypothetical protein n=1 Tax=Bradyrhizobium TaxID=374 RepID=UPI001E5734DE|nr:MULTISPECIES: hypothetical protein [Bradyrhizobium]
MLVAGMSIGTLFTIFVLPAVYVTIASDHRADASSGHAKNGVELDLIGAADDQVAKQ